MPQIEAQDIFESNKTRLIKALALLILDEINILRQAAGLQPRTIEQFKQALRDKYKQL
jgi:hypothetical protein